MQRDFLIHGAARTGTYRTIQSPYHGGLVGEVEVADDGALGVALSNAAQSFADIMQTLPAHERARILRFVSERITQNAEMLAGTIAREGGKPVRDARIEVFRAAITTSQAADVALTLTGAQIPMDLAPGTESHLAFTIRRPIGPVLAISAFNHPLNLICHQVATAIAASNSVIVKPASQTPLSCLFLAEYFLDGGLPPKALSVITPPTEKMDQVVSDPRLRHISFIGSEAVGWGLRSRIAPGVRLSLELGGTAASIVSPDIALDAAIPSLVRACFYHAGQVCVSTQILYVHKDIEREFTERFVSATKALYVGDPEDERTDIGPLISPREVTRVDEIVRDAQRSGGTVVTGGAPISSCCYPPTVIRHPGSGSRIMREEVFGPVVCVVPFSDISIPVAQINSSRYSFQTALYCRDIAVALRTARDIQSKSCIINDPTTFRVDWMPFGGARVSGLGVGGVKNSILEMTEEQLIVINTGR